MPDLGSKALSEFFASLLFIFIGNCGIANEILTRTKGHSMGFGFVALSFGLSIGLSVAVFGNVSAVS
jgi:glycerol uptake facilitator-like aquaporin